MTKDKFQEIIAAFQIDADTLRQIAASVRYDLELALNKNEASSLHIFDTHLGLPLGNEKGKFIALDFGGTNLRTALIELDGKGSYTILKKVSLPLRADSHDYTTAATSAEQLFDFIAAAIDKVIDGDKTTTYCLGHTFSFPAAQTDASDAKLVKWTKEFAVPNVEGHNINALLVQALQRHGLTNVQPTVLLNDTTAVLIAAAYQHDNVYIGSIYGTGHNTCYAETDAEIGRTRIINLEIGNFYKLFINKYDSIIDSHSQCPSEQRLEKMVSGRYLGQLFAAALQDVLSLPADLTFTTVDLAFFNDDVSENAQKTIDFFRTKANLTLSVDMASAIQDLASQILTRSAMIVAASYCGIAWHIYGDAAFHANVAVEGSLYEKVDQIKSGLAEGFSELLDDQCQLECFAQKDGPLLGAAIAAAMLQEI